AAGSGRCSGPLSVTSPDFPADLQRNPVAGRGSPRDDDRVRTAGRGLGSTHRRRVGPLDGEPTRRAVVHPRPSSPPRSGLVQLVIMPRWRNGSSPPVRRPVQANRLPTFTSGAPAGLLSTTPPRETQPRRNGINVTPRASRVST